MEERKEKIIIEPSENIRKWGREALAGKWFIAIVVTVLYSLFLNVIPEIITLFFGIEYIYYFLGQPIEYLISPMSSIYTLIISGPVTFGITSFFMALFRQDEEEQVGDLFLGFEKLGKTLGLFLWISLLVLLWCLIPIAGIVLGIMATIKYSQAYYILRDNPTKSIFECVNESKRLMQGNKAKYFCLVLSFIGWFLLAFIVAMIFSAVFIFFAYNPFMEIIMVAILGIPFCVVLAYFYTTLAGFYEVLTGKIEGEHYTPGEY